MYALPMSRRTLSLIIWIIGDVALFLASFSLAYFLRVGFILSSDFPFGQHMAAAAFTIPVWLILLLFTRTFALMRRQASARNILYMLSASVIATAFFALSFYFLYGLFFSRLLLVYAAVLTFMLPWMWHLVWEHAMRGWLRMGEPAYPTLIIGATREAASLIKLLQQTRSPLKPVAILDGKGAKDPQIEGVPVVGKLHKLDETLEKYRITHLVQCSDLEQSLNLLSACRQRRITYLLLPSVLGIIERDERIESLEGRAVTTVRPHEPWWQWFFS
jgi:FlaA1/EpsC-like NDP-sugar epimerase